MEIRILAIFGIVVITIAGMIIAALRPDEASSVLSWAAPTIATLVVLVKVQDYHLVVNSRMDELLKITASSSKAEGKLERIEEESVSAEIVS